MWEAEGVAAERMDWQSWEECSRGCRDAERWDFPGVPGTTMASCVGRGGDGEECRHNDSMNIVYNLLWPQAPSLHLAKVITETSVRRKVQLSPSGGGLGVGGRSPGAASPGGVIIAGGNWSEKGRKAQS